MNTLDEDIDAVAVNYSEYFIINEDFELVYFRLIF